MPKPIAALTIVIGLAASLACGPAWSQVAGTPASAASKSKPAKKPPRDKYGSPLDTLMTTHLWTDVPPAEGFVRDTRPDAKSLDYTPLTGTDPERPKPRDKANIMALQAELEHDGAVAQAKGRPLRVGARAGRKAKSAE